MSILLSGKNMRTDQVNGGHGQQNKEQAFYSGGKIFKLTIKTIIRGGRDHCLFFINIFPTQQGKYFLIHLSSF